MKLLLNPRSGIVHKVDGGKSFEADNLDAIPKKNRLYVVALADQSLAGEGQIFVRFENTTLWKQKCRRCFRGGK